MERRRASSPSRRKYRLLLRVYAAENLRHVASQGTFCRVTIEEGETPMRGSARASLKRLLQGSARANALESSDDPLASLPPRIVTTQVQKSLHGKPIWNEKFELPVVDASHEVVHFRIKSARVMSAPIIGGASVMLSDVPTDATMDRWLNLFDSSRKPAGKLRIQMRLSLMNSSTSSSSPKPFPASMPSPVFRPRSSTAGGAMATTTTTAAEERDTYYQHPRRTSNISPTPLPRSNRRGAIIAPPIGGVATFRRSSTLSRSMLEMRASGSTTASDSISSDHSHPNDSVVTPYTPSFNDSFVETPTASSSPLTNKQRDPPTPTQTPPARSTPTHPTTAVRDSDVSFASSRFTGLSDRARSTPSAAVRDTDVSRASSRFTGFSGHDRSTAAFSTSSRDTELDDLANKYMTKPTRETTINPVPEEPEASRKSSRGTPAASRDDSYASLKASFSMPEVVRGSMMMPPPESAWESSWETPSPVGRASSMVFGESEKESPDTWELTLPGRKKSTAVTPSTANPDTGNTWEWETLSPRWSSDTVPSPIEKPVSQDPSAVHGAPKKRLPVPVPMVLPVVAPPVPMVAPSVPLPVSVSASLSVPMVAPTLSSSMASPVPTSTVESSRETPSARVSKPKASRGSAKETPSPRVAKPSTSQQTPAVRELSMREQRTSQQIMPNDLEDFLQEEYPVEESEREQPVSTASSPSSSSSPSGPSLSDTKRHVSSSKKGVASDSKTSSSSPAVARAMDTPKNSPSPKDERSPRTTNTTARGSNEDDEDLGETIEFDFDTGDVRPSKRLPSHMMRSTISRSSIASSRMMSDGDESGIDHDDGYDSDDSEDEPEDDEMDPDGDPDGPRMVLRSTVTWLLGRDSVNVIMDVDEEDEDDDDFDPFVFDDLPLLDMSDTCFLIKDIDYADRTAAAS